MTLAVRRSGWQATPLLIGVGRINGILLPVILGVILLAAHRPSVVGSYRHPAWATAFGLVAWLTTVFMAGWTVWLMAR
jgi:Mn2+/Fe2+ NRAMP family transporter